MSSVIAGTRISRDLIRFPDKRSLSAYLCNLALLEEELQPRVLVRRVADVYLAGQFPVPPSPTPAPDEGSRTPPYRVAPADYAEYAGRYSATRSKPPTTFDGTVRPSCSRGPKSACNSLAPAFRDSPHSSCSSPPPLPPPLLLPSPPPPPPPPPPLPLLLLSLPPPPSFHDVPISASRCPLPPCSSFEIHRDTSAASSSTATVSVIRVFQAEEGDHRHETHMQPDHRQQLAGDLIYSRLGKQRRRCELATTLTRTNP